MSFLTQLWGPENPFKSLSADDLRKHCSNKNVLIIGGNLLFTTTHNHNQSINLPQPQPQPQPQPIH